MKAVESELEEMVISVEMFQVSDGTEDVRQGQGVLTLQCNVCNLCV